MFLSTRSGSTESSQSLVPVVTRDFKDMTPTPSVLSALLLVRMVTLPPLVVHHLRRQSIVAKYAHRPCSRTITAISHRYLRGRLNKNPYHPKSAADPARMTS